MTARLPQHTLAIGMATAVVATACRAPAPVVAPPPRDLIVLTLHPEDGALGIATVTTAAGSAALTEANPVVATADNTDEAKNRRVEVTVR